MPDANAILVCVGLVALEFVLFVAVPALRALVRRAGGVLYYVERCRTGDGWVVGRRNLRRADGGYESRTEALAACDWGVETFGGEWRVRRDVSSTVYARYVAADPPPHLLRPRPAADSTEIDDV